MALKPTRDRIRRLEQHLKQENPVLAECIKSFLKLDRIAHGLGLADSEDSYAAQVAWLPVISVLGTFSAGKSTFLNQYLGCELQRTGNQAVDDKFTVVCFGTEPEPKTLPGLALDSDPRFPFYQISQNIEQVSQGEGRRVDSYLQLKTVHSDALRGKIFIDSPGFDADRQRDSTLLLTDHIINLSDLVLVFFDARHPEPGAMGDTLQHLVSETVGRADATKFLYVLNQIDNTAKEDNPEEVVAAWQRALAQHGLTAGRFYRIYARGVDVSTSDPRVRERLERKRDEDLGEIESRIRQVEVERAYRVVGMLEKTATHIRDDLVPKIIDARRKWFRLTAWLSGLTFGVLALGIAWWGFQAGWWRDLQLQPLSAFFTTPRLVALALVLLAAGLLHRWLRALAGRMVLRRLQRAADRGSDDAAVAKAFAWNMKGAFLAPSASRPRGWNWRSRRGLERILKEANGFVQILNDKYANPSGPPK